MTDTHQSEESPDMIRVLTFNLLSPGQADWEPRRAVAQPVLRELRPDVVAFQETVWGSGYDQATDLLGPDYQVVRHSGRSADGVGAVLASRWPFGTIREVDLHVTNRVDDLPWSAAVAAEVELPPPFGLSLFVHHSPPTKSATLTSESCKPLPAPASSRISWPVAICTSSSLAISTTYPTLPASASGPAGRHCKR